MPALIVVAHPETSSLTHQLAAEVARGLGDHPYELADLAAEGFEPRFGVEDRKLYRRQAAAPIDVAREQARIDRADTLVIVYPVYWWSMPALLKGWIDRVFQIDWAYGYADGKVTKLLQRLRVHLIAVAATDAALYARHRYDDAMKVQIEHGIFDYCGAKVESSLFMFDSESQDPTSHLARAHALGVAIKESHDATSNSVSSGPASALRDQPLLGGDSLG